MSKQKETSTYIFWSFPPLFRCFFLNNNNICTFSNPNQQPPTNNSNHQQQPNARPKRPPQRRPGNRARRPWRKRVRSAWRNDDVSTTDGRFPTTFFVCEKKNRWEEKFLGWKKKLKAPVSCRMVVFSYWKVWMISSIVMLGLRDIFKQSGFFNYPFDSRTLEVERLNFWSWGLEGLD